jgi:hypothetical protein
VLADGGQGREKASKLKRGETYRKQLKIALRMKAAKS